MPKGSRYFECSKCHVLGNAYYLSEIDPETGYIVNVRVCQGCWEKSKKKPKEDV